MTYFDSIWQLADALGGEFSTDNRPLRLVLDGPGGPHQDALLPQCVSAMEAICGGLELRILCVSTSATLALKDFIGLPAELQVVTDRGQLRRHCGIVTGALAGDSDGGLATYQLIVRDALAVMEHRINTRVFRGMSELDVIETLVKEWQVRNPVLGATFDIDVDVGLAGTLAPREFIMQHNQSDAAFVRYLMQRRGIAWFFRPGLPHRAGPRQAGSIGQQQSGRIGHTLVLFNDAHRLKENSAGRVRFHRDDATEERDAITAWGAMRTLQPGRLGLYSWDYKNPDGTAFNTTEAASGNHQGEQGAQLACTLEHYVVEPPHLGASAADLTELGNRHMAHFDYAAKTFYGEGAVRDLACGEWFTLDGHPEIDTHPIEERQFVVTGQRFVCRNNLPTNLQQRVARLLLRSDWLHADWGKLTDDNGHPIRYRTQFQCVRRGIAIVPPRPAVPRPQLQSAIVVGPAGEEAFCDQLGRIKVRFPAARPDDHEHASGAGTSNTDGDSAWVRLASNWAGGQLGARTLPRVGTEVLIDWMGGDPDKPIIVGQLYNSIAPPPPFEGEHPLPATRYQSGMRSREIRGQRGNQLRLDDTPGQISAQLASDHAATELNLGYLTDYRRDGRTAPRGEGAELRTDEAIALQAARGIFLNAGRLLDAASSRATQLSRDEFLSLLRECGELFSALGNYAAQHSGLPVSEEEQKALLARFTNWEDGSNTRPKAPTPREPVLGMAASAGIGFASSQAIVSYSAKNIDTVAQQHLQLASGQRVNVNAGHGMSLFSRSGGLQAIAHTGKMLLQSQHGDIEVNADENVRVTASKGTVTLMADKLLLVTSDGSFFRMGDGAPVIGSKQPIKFHAPDFLWDGPETMETQLPVFKKTGTELHFEPRYYPHMEGGIAAAGLNYTLDSSAASNAGVTDDAGKSDVLENEQMQLADIHILNKGDA